MDLPIVTPDKTDKQVKELKKLSLVNNIHNLTPQLKTNKEEDSVAIINALKSDSLIKDVILELEGYVYSHKERGYTLYRKPIMNSLGIGNFITCISSISKTIEFSSFKEKQIPKLANYFFKTNYPYFTVYYEDYELDRKDFNLISTILLAFIVSSFNKAKGAGHRNVVRGTYSEDLLGRYTGELPNIQGSQKSKFNLGLLNPFKKAGNL
ncbi:hypothetical protein LCGC14_0732200 [marine sediment metagenome]|uniref:Uncharacterized protein n=1 Tax=marine sediment metagenome TaxID=412755 RepID=A0A0F9QDF8_9ZZZZ|nr:hypothetical protein [bacterium]